jgi:DNA-binding GntR family transcriptional regulator
MDNNTVFKETIQTRTLPDQVFDYIKRMIMTLELKPGEKIPEDRIAELLGVSRTPIREAIRKLQQYGIVEVIPRRFAKVVEINNEAKHNLGEIRIAIDSISVRRLAGIATKQQCDILRKIAQDCINLSETGNRVELFERDSEFHIAVARMSGNPYLADIVTNLTAKVQFLLANSYHGMKYSRREQFTHLKIIESIEKNDADSAVKYAVSHLEKFYNSEADMI